MAAAAGPGPVFVSGSGRLGVEDPVEQALDQGPPLGGRPLEIEMDPQAVVFELVAAVENPCFAVGGKERRQPFEQDLVKPGKGFERFYITVKALVPVNLLIEPGAGFTGVRIALRVGEPVQPPSDLALLFPADPQAAGAEKDPEKGKALLYSDLGGLFVVEFEFQVVFEEIRQLPAVLSDFGLGGGENDIVVAVADVGNPVFDGELIETVKVEVGQQRRDHRSLGDPFPGVGEIPALVDVAGPQPEPHQVDQPLVIEGGLKAVEQLPVRQRGEEIIDVGRRGPAGSQVVQDMADPPAGLDRPFPPPVGVAAVEEVLFEERFD